MGSARGSARSSEADETCLEVIDRIDEQIVKFQTELESNNNKIEQLIENSNFILTSQEINDAELNQIEELGEEDFGDCDVDEGVQVRNRSFNTQKSLM